MYTPCINNILCEYTKNGFAFLSAGGKLKEAQQSFQNGIILDPNNSMAWAGLGVTFRGLNELDLSAEALERSINVDRCNSYAQYQLFTTKSRMPIDQRDPIEHLKRCIGKSYCDEAALSYAAGVVFGISLLLNEKSRAITSVKAVFSISDPSIQNSNIKLMTQVLSLPKIGRCSVQTLREIVMYLRQYLTIELISTSSETIKNSLLHLASLIRAESISEILVQNKLNWCDVDDALLVNMLLLDVSEISKVFKDTCFKSFDSCSSFKKICWVCFNSVYPHEVATNLSNNPFFVELLKESSPDDKNQILSTTHQAYYNVYISGNLVKSRVFSRALAELNKIFFGSYDSFHRDGVGYLNRDWIAAFGHIVFIDLLLNAEKLSLGPKLPRHISCYANEFANSSMRELLEYNGFTISKLKEEDNEPRRWQMDYILPTGKPPRDFLEFCNEIQAKITNAGMGHSLELPQEWDAKGRVWLEERGIDETDKVVVIHCRESSFWVNLHNVFMNSRNVKPTNYIPAITYLLGKGIHVIRLGDSGMSSYENIKHSNFIDLALDENAPSYLDFYLLKRANFFIGSTSGPSAIANIFKTSCLLSNWFPLNVYIPNANNQCLIMPKMVETIHGLASLEDLMEDPLSSTEILDKDKNGNILKLIDNSEEDILDAVKELIEPDMTRTCSPIEFALNQVWNKHIPWKIAIPKSFIKKYGSALLKNG